MKTLTPEMQAHLAQDTTTLATCWMIERTDGQMFYFTDHNEVVTFWGSDYLPSTGFRHSAIATTQGANVDNLEVDSVLSDETITDAELLAGVWDFAKVEIFLVNWQDTSMDRVLLRAGTLGEVKTGRNSFNAELRGLTQPLQQNIGRIYTITCDADLGDGRCQVDIWSLKVTATVTSVTSQSNFTATSLTQAAGYFTYGLLTFNSGANAGRSMEVRSFSAGGVLDMQMVMPYAVSVGDTFTVQPGCDKTLATCVSRYSNAINFQGFPHLPGNDRLVTGD